MVSLLAVACCGIHVEPGPDMTEYEKLEELGIDEETYRAMPIERQIEIFLEMQYYFPHNSAVRMWMEDAIIANGQEAVGPVVENIRGLAAKEDISTSQKRAIDSLMLVLGWIHLSERADLKGTDAQTVLEEVAASNLDPLVKRAARRNLYRILCDKSPPTYPEEPDLTCAE